MTPPGQSSTSVKQRTFAQPSANASRLEHVGSTSVPGLIAKPIVDVLLAVSDSSDEATYVPPMEQAGYVLRIREPDWHQHRVFKGPDTEINLHVFSDACPEIERMLLFRDCALECRRSRVVRGRIVHEPTRLTTTGRGSWPNS